MLSIIFNFLAANIFLFILWKRLKEDYASKMIFSTGFFVIFGFLIGRLISIYLSKDYWFWIVIFGGILGLMVGLIKYKMKFFETLDACIPGFLFWALFVFLSDSIAFSNLSSLIASGIVLLIIVLFFFLDSRYKRFVWYRSGRIGFSGFSVLGIFFILRAVFAAAFIDVLSFVGTLDVIISAVVAFFSFLIVFNLARNKI